MAKNKGNPQNLINYQNKLTPEQIRERNSKAGKASGKSRAERKTFREQLLLALQTINPETGNTFNEDVVANLLSKALYGPIGFRRIGIFRYIWTKWKTNKTNKTTDGANDTVC